MEPVTNTEETKQKDIQELLFDKYKKMNRKTRREIDRKAAKLKKANLKAYPSRREYEKTKGIKKFTFTQALNESLRQKAIMDYEIL